MSETPHQSLLAPAENKFHVGNGEDGKHYWLSPPSLLDDIRKEFGDFFDACPYPKPDDFDGLTDDWGPVGGVAYANIPFGSVIHQGKKKGPTFWMRKAIEQSQRGRTVVLVYPLDKWVLMVIKHIFGEACDIRNLGDVRWHAIEDGSQGKGTGRHIAMFIFRARDPQLPQQTTGANRD